MKDLRSDSACGLSGVLKKLGAMTAIRDSSMVEQSLLRTLGPLLGVLETSFYRTNDRGDVIRALYHSHKVVDKNGVKHVVDNIEEVISENEIPDVIGNLFDSVYMFHKACSQKLDKDLLIGYPIYGVKELLGYFVFQRDREVTPVEDAIIHGVLEVFTNYFDLLDTSQRDQLTGLLNRYSLEANLDRLWNLLPSRLDNLNDEQKKTDIMPAPYWLGILDIDHFKKINDTYGHVMGDEVLIMTARLLQASFRKSDLLYRYGGEEFIAIIAANDLESVTHVFERARMKIEQFQFPQVGFITISGGFSGADSGVLPQEVINRADSALYAAKNAGRNRICHYDTLISEGVLKEINAGDIDLF